MDQQEDQPLKICLDDLHPSDSLDSEIIREAVVAGDNAIPCAAFDIGGSLTKVVHFVPDMESSRSGFLHFASFNGPKDRVGELCRYVIQQKKRNSRMGILKGNIPSTGGGTVKYGREIEDFMGSPLSKMDEVVCMVRGLHVTTSTLDRERYRVQLDGLYGKKVFIPREEPRYPFLLVMVGSGISLVVVESQNSFTRVGGTSVGGSTFMGLASIMTGVSNFDEALELACEGENSSCDLLVGDIYGSSYDSVGLDSDVIAGSFGKIANNPLLATDAKNEDILSSLLAMMSYNISQIAFLTAKTHNCGNNAKIEDVYFCGSYLRCHKTRNYITSALKFWSQGNMRALFLRHGSYIGALGAFFSACLR